MSINITVHGSPKKCLNKKRFLLDDEQAKRELLEERKKLRLKQVREKSKEVAQQVRRNVDEAKRKQLRTIEETKTREMWLSRGEKMRQKCEEYKNTLQHVGESHVAAAEENYCCPCSEYSPASCRHTGDKWGDIRPTEPRPKEAQPGMSYNSFCRERAKKRLNKENHSPKTDKTKYSLPNSVKRAPTVSPCGKRNQSYSSDASTRATLYSPYRRPTPKRRNGLKAKKKLVKTPSVILEIDSENDSSGLEVEDTRNDSNMKFTRVCSKSKHYPSATTINELPYNCSDYKGTDSSCADQTPSCAEQIPSSKIRFTQISDLIKQQDDKRSTCPQEQIREISSRCVTEKEALPTTSQSCSPPRSPPKPTPEPPQRISSLKTTSKVSTKTDGTSQVTNRVQFFDYRNKFQKSYPRPNVVRTERDCSQPNAMQQAEEEKDLVNAYFEKLRKLSEKCESRSQKALEKERIRRDCQDLTAKLEALSKGKTNYQLNSDDAHQFSEARLKHVSSERQCRMNDAVENVLKRPVLITCPEVERAPRSEDPQCFGRATPRDLNVFSQHKLTSATGDNTDSLNTSDSCASILLKYVNSQSKKISDDISNCDNTEKVEKLKDLLEKINNLRKRLLEELEKAKESENGPEIKEVVDGIGTLSKERETILQEPEVEKERNLEQREKKLKKREEILEKKLKEFYELTKAKNAENNSTSESVESVELSAQKLKSNTPLEIIIKLKDSNSKTSKKSPYKIPRKRSSLINSPRKKKVIPRKDLESELSKKLEKCHADLKKCQVDLEKCHDDMENGTTPQSVENHTSSHSVENQATSQSVENSCSTLYRSPPNKISPPLKAALEKREKEKVTSSRTEVCKPSQPSLKSLSCETTNRLSRPRTTASNFNKDKRVESPCKGPSKKNLNPVLVHYIQRLLGMSRGSIEMLGVSTSEVDTPSSSIINVSANKSETESVLNHKDKLARLEKFIQDSYSFASEIETSMRSVKSNSTDSSPKTIEEIWKRMLKQKHKSGQSFDRCKSPKPILKKDKGKKFPQASVSPTKSKKSEDTDKVNLVNKYTQLTDSCAQRIAELTEMINKVRQEKQRILDITLSSASPSARSTTEYVDFAERGTGKPGTPQQNVQVEQECEKGRLEKNKLTGVSRDSGISTTSRPATALDFRESPALQFCAQGNVVFEPILKDIPKPKSSTPPIQPVPQKGVVENSKKGKPPATMARYSPQLDELPHELSTIIEVDTTPRISVSNVEKQLKEPLVQLQKDMEITHTYSKFPTFEEYVRQNKIDLTMLDPDVSSKLQVELQELLNVANAAKKIQYKEFPSKCNNIEDEDDDIQESIENLVQSLKMLNIGMKSFPTHDEYVEQLKRTDIMQTTDKSSDNAEDKTKSEVMSIESLPDIVGELIRRKMLKHSFRNVNDASIKKEDKRSKSSKNFGSDTSKSQPEKDLMGSSSPKKKTTSRKDVEEELLSGLEMLHFSNQSNSDNIEKELEGMGLKWAALMLRKSQNTQDINSSTSSSILFTSRRKSGKKKSAQKEVVDDSKENKNTTQQESLEGRPLNLRDFLAKELQKRTQLSSSSSSQDDSLASQFLRSMFGSDSSETRRITQTSEQHTNRILTSTPVPAGSTSSSKPTTNHSTQKLFAAESLSTVRYSHSDSDGPCNSAEKLIPPNVRLESKIISSSSSNRDS